MIETSVLWLRAAAFLYAAGMVHALIFVLRRSTALFPAALGAFRVGVLLHGVAIVELGIRVRHIPADNVFESLSLCAFLMGVAFLIVHSHYGLSSGAIAVFPLVFFMAQVGAMELPVAGWTDARVRGAWLWVHVLLILAGLAALLLTAVSSVLYLMQERRLKRKTSGGRGDRLPPLATLDNLITSGMGLGFVLMTLGVIVASTWAFIESGTRWLFDPTIAVSLLTWVLCLAMVFLRTSAGWRGRKAAIMSLVILGCSALTWAAHVGLRTRLIR